MPKGDQNPTPLHFLSSVCRGDPVFKGWSKHLLIFRSTQWDSAVSYHSGVQDETLADF